MHKRLPATITVTEMVKKQKAKQNKQKKLKNTWGPPSDLSTKVQVQYGLGEV